MRDRNTFAKRQRETKQKQKAEDKRVRRQKRKDGPAPQDPAFQLVDGEVNDEPQQEE